MMTDTEIKTMRDSVRGMPVMQAAALPIYDQFRGLRDDNGTPLEQVRALYDGAVYSAPEPSREACRAAAYRDQMIADMANAHKRTASDNGSLVPSLQGSTHIPDGVDPVEHARTRMIADMANQHRAA
ncbi:MAG: hypothetical protein ACK4ZU_01980 [Allorhizobium sp.]